MKVRILKTLILVSLLVWGCSKNDDTVLPKPDPITEGNGEIVEAAGVNEENFEAYQGDIGIIIEARNVAKKGYTPAQAIVTVNATLGDYSKTIDLDSYSHMGQIKLALKDLSDEAQNELKDGIEISAEILDEEGNIITQETVSKASFKTDPNHISIKATNLGDLDTNVYLKENTPYYVQVVDEDGKPVGTMKRNSGILAYDVIASTAKVSYTGDDPLLLFSFQPIPNKINTYGIKQLGNEKHLRISRSYAGYPTGVLFGGLKIHQAIVADINLTDDQLLALPDSNFIIEKIKDGIYRMKSTYGENIKVASGVGYTLNYPGATNLYFRFIPMNIDWQIENIATHYLEPILPPAKTGFGFNNTLINCGSGSLEQTVGVEISETVSTTTGWEESISVMSSHTASVSTTVGVEFEAGFFGTSAKYSAEITAGYEYTTENTSESTKWGEKTKEIQETYFSERVVTVPPKNASLVYDAFQVYDNIKMNFVQQLRVKATEHDTGESLSGNEIKSQFHFNGFNGIITEVGSDYIEITLRGVTTLDKVIKTESKVTEVDPMCN